MMCMYISLKQVYPFVWYMDKDVHFVPLLGFSNKLPVAVSSLLWFVVHIVCAVCQILGLFGFFHFCYSLLLRLL